jgi:hypothetical protein
MSRKYNKILLVERGIREFNQIENIAFRLEESFEEYSKSKRLLFNYKSNGKFEKKGKEQSFVLRTSISPEVIQDLVSFNNVDAELELNSLLREHIEGETINRVLNQMLLYKTNFKILLIEKVDYEFELSLDIKNLFNKILKKYNTFEYDLIVSPEVFSLIKDEINFITSKEPIENICYSLGFEKVGYWFFNLNSKKIAIYQTPYFPENKCLLIKNLRSPEFFVDLNTVEITYNHDMFIPEYRRHIAHLNIPNDMNYRSFKIKLN